MRSVLVAAVLLAAAASAAGAGREPVIGLPCEGCEAVFDGLPAEVPARARIAPASAPGEPMVLAGTVRAQDGTPHPGIIVYAYQTDSTGVYPPLAATDVQDAATRRHGRLRAWARSDASGRYAFDTVRPGGYPGTDIPQHIHLHVIEPGCATYYIDDVMFTDDPRLTPQRIRQLAVGRGGRGIVTPVREDEVWQATRDILLGQAIPGYDACRE